MEYLVNEKRNNQLFPGKLYLHPGKLPGELARTPGSWRSCQLRGRRRAV